MTKPRFASVEEYDRQAEVLAKALRASPEHRLMVNRTLGVVFGIIGPAVCLKLDSSMLGIFDGHRWAARVLIGTQMLLLCAWLSRPARSPRIAAVFAGAFVIGTVFATANGIILAPLGLLLIFTGIGLLGFIPLGTAYVFGRVAHDAFAAMQAASVRSRPWDAALGALLAIGPAIAIEVSKPIALERALHQLREPDPAAIDAAQRTIGALPWFEDGDLVRAWDGLSDQSVRDRLSELHRRRTGQTIEEFEAERAD